MDYGRLTVPQFNRSFSLDTGNYFTSYLDNKAEQIMSKFEKMKMDSIESVNTQSPLPVEQTGEEDIIQYVVPKAQPVMAPMIGLQRQFSEFPLDQVRLSY